MDSFISQLGEADEPARSEPLPEAIVARLQEAAARFLSPCPYSAGDLVIARKDAPVGGFLKTRPVLVLGAAPDCKSPLAHGEGNRSGYRYDLWLALLDDDDDICAALYESAFFEPWPRAEEPAQPISSDAEGERHGDD